MKSCFLGKYPANPKALCLVIFPELFYPRLVVANGRQVIFLSGFGLLLAGFNALKVFADITGTTNLFWLKDDYLGWGALTLLALGPTLLGFGLYNLSLVRLEAGKVNLIAATEPVFTAILAYLLLGEIISKMQILGGVLIFGSIYTLRLVGAGYRNGLQLAAPKRPVPAPAVIQPVRSKRGKGLTCSVPHGKGNRWYPASCRIGLTCFPKVALQALFSFNKLLQVNVELGLLGGR